jgi:hypothetical protein
VFKTMLRTERSTTGRVVTACFRAENVAVAV